MKENKKKIVNALIKKHIKTIKMAKLSSIGGGRDGCVVVIDTD